MRLREIGETPILVFIRLATPTLDDVSMETLSWRVRSPAMPARRSIAAPVTRATAFWGTNLGARAAPIDRRESLAAFDATSLGERLSVSQLERATPGIEAGAIFRHLKPFPHSLPRMSGAAFVAAIHGPASAAAFGPSELAPALYAVEHHDAGLSARRSLRSVANASPT